MSGTKTFLNSRLSRSDSKFRLSLLTLFLNKLLTRQRILGSEERRIQRAESSDFWVAVQQLGGICRQIVLTLNSIQTVLHIQLRKYPIIVTAETG